MASIPKHVTHNIIRHEWIIGEGTEHCLARDLRDGIYFAEQEMTKLGLDVSYDDAYNVRAGDGGEVILYVDVDGA